jgi:LPXTG-site transpeptidase (sortase) family protein
MADLTPLPNLDQSPSVSRPSSTGDIDPSWSASTGERGQSISPTIVQPAPRAEPPYSLGDQLSDTDSSPTPVLTEFDRPVDPLWLTLVKSGVAFLGSAALAYLVLTFPSQFLRVSYAVRHLGQANQPTAIVQAGATSGQFTTIVQPSLSFSPPTDAPTSPTGVTTAVGFSSLTNNELVIPKIAVRAPIIWDSSFEESVMLENLRSGVVHYGGTDRPSRDRGNVFITGHSSYYWWDSGRYKTVFALLDKLVAGDQVALTYQGDVYVYEVTRSVVVKPTAIEVLASTETPQLSLMTCTPVGTSLNRLVVVSRLIGVFSTELGPEQTTQPTPPAAEPSRTLDLLPGW